MERAYAMPLASRSTLLTSLPATAFDAGDIPKARAYAEQLLNEASRQGDDWNYGNLIHKGNLILGRIAVREGRIADAVTFLRRPVKHLGPLNSIHSVRTCRSPGTC